MTLDSRLSDLVEKRNQAWEAAKHYWESESTTLEASDAEAAARANEEISQMDARIRELHEINQANKKAEEYRDQYERFVPLEDRQQAETRERNALRAFARGETRHLDLDFGAIERHVNNDGSFEIRDLKTYTGAAGGDTVPTSFLHELYEHMIHASAIRQTNARIVRTSSGEALEMPKTLVYGTAAIVGEGTGLAEADPTFDKITLNAWKYGQLLQASYELLQDTGVALDGFLARDLGRALGQATGQAFVTGSGTNAPRGVITAVSADVGTAVQVASATVESDNLIDLMYHVIPPYRVNGFWLMADSTEKAIRKLKNADDQYVWQPGIQAGVPAQILGRPVVVDPFVAAIGSANKSVAFGDFSGFVIREAGPVRIERSDDYAFNADMTTFRAIQRVDSDLIDLNAIDVLDTD